MPAGRSQLTAKQEAFCEEYMVDLNGAQAAIRAGYSENSAKEIGSENLTKPNVQQRIAELKAERSERTEISADYVLSSLKEVADRCMKAEAITSRTDGEEVETGEYRFEHAGANKALELLGKHLKLFTDKVDHSGTIGLESILGDIEDDGLPTPRS